MFDTAREPFEWVAIVGFPLGFGLASVTPTLVPLLYGSDYQGTVPTLSILAIGLPLMYLNIMVGQSFVSSDRPGGLAGLLAGAAVVNVLLNLTLIPLTQAHWGNGAIGAAISLSVTELLQLAMGVAVIGHRLIARTTLVSIAKVVVASSTKATVVLLVGASNLVVEALVVGLVYVGFCLLLRLPTQREIETARALVLKVVDRVSPTESPGG